MSHLGPRVAALVDGELAPDAAARAHAHAASCPPCLAAVEAERQVRERLSTAPDPQVPTGLSAALLAMGGPSGPLPPRPGHVPGGPRPEALTIRPPGGRPDPGPGRSASRSRPTPARAERAPGAATGAPGPRGGRRRSGTGPGRGAHRRLAAVVAGSFSLASVGLFSMVALTGALDDGRTAPVTTQLTVDPRSGTRPTAVSVSRSTSQPLTSPATSASTPPTPTATPTLLSASATSTLAPSATAASRP